MKLQDQCCTVEQGKRLVELGVTAPAMFYHMPAKDGPHGPWIRYGWHGDALAPAYNVAELGVLLDWHCYTRQAGDDGGQWVYEDTWMSRKGGFHSEAQARAALIILQLETTHLTCQIANERLEA